MPTGYTSGIYQGEKKISFRDFALGCARAFGALIVMRDEPGEAPIPDEFKPGDYHEKALKIAEESLERISKWAVPDADVEADLAYKSNCEQWDKAKEKQDALRARYEEMLAHVAAWDPPTPDHRELKNFMREQLETSIKHDCSMYERPEREGGLEYRAKMIKSAEWSVKYQKEELQKEIDRCRERTEWVQALKKSL